MNLGLQGRTALVLVARTLETAWEQTLTEAARQRVLLAELDRQRPAPLTEVEQRALRRLAGELDRVWSAKTTTDRDRKERCARCLMTSC